MFPNEASYLYDWTSTSKLSYVDFLRAKQFEHSVRYAIDNQTKELVATNQQLAEHEITALSENLDRGFTMLSQDIVSVREAVQDGTEKITGVLNWGFNEVLVSLGRVNDSLSQLIQFARTPSQTWSYEQFEIARDEFRRGLFLESLESVTRAIGGHGSNPGYKTEFRFHFLLGIIRLGSYKNSSAEIVDPKISEQAFLTAARYAEADFPEEAGRALICAGRAAYVLGGVTRATNHTKNGLLLAPRHADGLYQFARLLSIEGQLQEASANLVKSIVVDVRQAIPAAADLEFLSKKSMLQSALGLARQKYEQRYSRMATNLDEAYRKILDFSFGGIGAGPLLQDRVVEVRAALKASRDVAVTGTIIGFADATKQLLVIRAKLPSYFDDYRKRFIGKREQELSDRSAPGYEDLPSRVIAAIAGFFVGLVACVIAMVFQVSGFTLQPGQDLLSYLFVPVGAGILVGIAFAVVTAIIKAAKQAAGEAARDSDSALRAKVVQDIATIERAACPWERATPGELS